jgi:transcriptional regulator with XRE-family HTH domain
MRLSRYLKLNGLSEGEFAARVPVAHSTVWRITRGQMSPRPPLRQRIVAATRGEVSEAELLLEGSGIPDDSRDDSSESEAA